MPTLDLTTTSHQNTSEKDRADLVLELGSAYILNLLCLADEKDEGGLGHPLEKKYQCLQVLIDELNKKGLLSIETYKENEEEGEEYVPNSKADQYFDQLNKITEDYQREVTEIVGLDLVRKSFFLGMGKGTLQHIDETHAPWYEQISSFQFYENLVPPPKTPTPPPKINEADYETPSVIEINDSIDIQHSVYRYRKPAMIHAGISIIFILLYAFAWKFAAILCIIFLILAAYYYSKLITIHSDGLTASDLMQKKHLDWNEIDEVLSTEEDGEEKHFEVLGKNGRSIKITSSIEDYQALKNYIDRIASHYAE